MRSEARRTTSEEIPPGRAASDAPAAAAPGTARATTGRAGPSSRRRRAFDDAAIGMGLCDLEGAWLDVNRALCELAGLGRAELLATPLAAITHPDDRDLDRDDRAQLLAGTVPSYRVEQRLLSGGEEIWVLVTVSPARDGDGPPSHLVVQVTDISERRRLAMQLEYLMDHDALTGLFNRRRFDQELAQQVDRAARYGAGGAVLMMDLDHFKEVNDTFGHKAGDDLLKAIAGEVRRRARKTDILARLSGDEFALLLPAAGLEEATLVAEAIVRSVRQHVATLGTQSIPMTASVGVALVGDLTDAEVMAYADHAMYQAKEGGRDRMIVYSPSTGRHRYSQRLDEAGRLRRALAEDRLVLHAQPILALGSDEICQYELLVRMRGEGGQDGDELLMPGSFLYVAERFDMVQAVDRWVVAQAIALIAEHERAGGSLVLEVNLSGKSIGDPELAVFVERRLGETGIDPAALIFELTETAAIANLEDAQRFAQRLRGIGCRFALDDFGAGFGSFYYLKHLPFDFIKIDGDFIRGLVGNRTDQLVVEAIVTIARGMGKRTIAEFVTEPRAAALLRDVGVDFAQGFHVGRPGPLEDVLHAPGSRAS